jgi:hypothetical protein
LTDLNTAEFQAALRTQVKADDFAYYRSQGWLSSLVNTILIEEVHLEAELVNTLAEASTQACAEGGSANAKGGTLGAICAWQRKVHTCLRSPDVAEKRASREGELVYVYRNDPSRRCRHVAFQAFFTQIRVLEGVSLDVDPPMDPDGCEWQPAPAKIEKSKDTKVKEKPQSEADDKQIKQSVKDGNVSVDIGVNLKVSEKKSDKNEKSDEDVKKPMGLNIPKGLSSFLKLKNFKEAHALDRLRNTQVCLLKVGKKPISIVWRSPERMVRYLGEVLAAHTLGVGDNKGSVQILNENGELVDLFRVEMGRSNNAAVVVEGPDGETFFIPPPQTGTRNAHLSLHSLAFVIDSVNLAVSGKELPKPATLFLPGG